MSLISRALLLFFQTNIKQKIQFLIFVNGIFWNGLSIIFLKSEIFLEREKSYLWAGNELRLCWHGDVFLYGWTRIFQREVLHDFF